MNLSRLARMTGVSSGELQRAMDTLWADGCPSMEEHEEAPRKPVTRVGQSSATGLRCVSIRPPYGTWLANPQRFEMIGLPPKRIENRSYDFTCGYRGQILIHQSKTFERDAIPAWCRRMPGIERIFSLDPGGYPHGAIIGIANLVDVIEDSDDPWFLGEYGLVLANARPVYPMAYRGQLGLFNVPTSVVEQLEEVAA
jgi:hypothetical protein